MIRRVRRRQSRRVFWDCQCTCGATTIVDAASLRTGVTRSCGCLSLEQRRALKIDLTGKRFGRLLVLRRDERHTRWWCQCDCGVQCSIPHTSLCGPQPTQSCGCLLRETRGQHHRTHGMSNTPEYRIWLGIIKRCTNPNNKAFKNYGGRGIDFLGECRRTFMAFFDFVGPRPSPRYTIDRIDNNGPYTGPCAEYPNGNLRWATPQEQANNSRWNHRLTFRDEQRTIAEWARYLQVKPHSLIQRLRRGWSIERTLTEPIRRW